MAGVFSAFCEGMFFKSGSHGLLSSSAYSWLNSCNMEDRARENLFQTKTPQGKLCSSFFFRRSILYVYFQTSLRFANIFSSNSLSLVLFMSPRCCILVFLSLLFIPVMWRARKMFAEELFNGFQSFQINRK